MNNDTLQMAADSLNQLSQYGGELNWWMVIAIAEFVFFIIFAVFSRRKTYDEKRVIKAQVKNEGDVDIKNTIESAFGAKALYDELIRKCHPDRFAPNEGKMAVANDITERLGKYKHNLKMLNKLKEEAINKLNINP